MEEGKVMMINRPTIQLALAASLSSFFVVFGFAQPSITSIQLTYKRDPRQVDPTRGIGPWVSGPNYSGAYAQDTVEVRAEGVDAAGKASKISPEWIPSDPEMLTVSPNHGDDVRITVRQAGESTLKIVYQGVSKELEIKAKNVNKFIAFEIGEAKAMKPAATIATGPPPARKTESDLSYAAGVNLARALQEQSVEVDVNSLTQGVEDTLSGVKARMSEEQAAAALQGLQTDLRILQANLTRKALAEKNKREGDAFLAENKKKEGVVTQPSGLQYKILKQGGGKKPTPNDLVVCGYRASFINGTEFGNSYKQSANVTFPIKSAVKGWAEALQLMPVGSKWQLFVPPELAYGDRGAGGGGGRKAGPAHELVGPNATLIFELELLAIQEPGTNPVGVTPMANKDALPPEILETLKKATETESKTDSHPETKEIDK